ncbi:MAG: hypothetical protein LUI87_06715 [Lachnospiraceae bacterium]|nr:hypothetical protein [Lachnospiraceae bacterium]
MIWMRIHIPISEQCKDRTGILKQAGTKGSSEYGLPFKAARGNFLTRIDNSISQWHAGIKAVGDLLQYDPYLLLEVRQSGSYKYNDSLLPGRPTPVWSRKIPTQTEGDADSRQ